MCNLKCENIVKIECPQKYSALASSSSQYVYKIYIKLFETCCARVSSCPSDLFAYIFLGSFLSTMAIQTVFITSVGRKAQLCLIHL